MKYKKEKDCLIITPENEEDLFLIGQIIEKGDIIEGKDVRKVKIGEDVIKKNYYLIIKVEEVKIENPLRIKGIVLNEHEDFPKGVYHSFTITPFKTFKLKKKFFPFYIYEILNKPIKDPINVLLIDDEKAEFYELRENNFKLLKVIKYKKKEELEKGFFDYSLIIKEIKDRKWKNFIIGGPGLFKEELLKELKNKKIPIEKVYLANISYIGTNGIKELLKRNELKTLLKDFKIKEEQELIEKFFEKLKKEENVIYGLEDIKKGLEYGAIELILVDSDLIFKEKNKEVLDIIKKVEEMKGKVKLIQTEEKKKLKSFGKIVAFLRFPIVK